MSGIALTINEFTDFGWFSTSRIDRCRKVVSNSDQICTFMLAFKCDLIYGAGRLWDGLEPVPEKIAG
jgi:hypothetical protein